MPIKCDVCSMKNRQNPIICGECMEGDLPSKTAQEDSIVFKFSEHGVKNQEAYITAYADFIEWCKSILPQGTFSTYMDGEPVCFCAGLELSYRTYLKSKRGRKA